MALQDTHDIDVNLLLFCAWVGVEKRQRLARADLERLNHAVGAWRETVVKPLRSVRRAIKTLVQRDPALDELRKRIAADELEAERIEQAMLFALAPRGGSASVAGETDASVLARANIALLLDGRTAALPEALIAAAARAVAPGRPSRG